ncbi:MAG: hypothetical protein QMC36_01280, partial [Patescibacteria group bacterium]
NFDPNVPNPEAVADYVAESMFIRDGSDAFIDNLKKNPECAAGFVRNWNERHPVRLALEKRGFVTEDVVNTLSIAHGTLSAEFTNRDGSQKDYEKAVENRNESLKKFDDMVRTGFPNPKDPQTAKDIEEIFEKGGQFVCGDIVNKLKSNAKLALQFIGVWEMGDKNPLRKAFANHPNDSVRYAADFFDGTKGVIAEAYGFDAYNLPDNFGEVAKDQLERFERRGQRAKEVAKWNEENRRFLTEKWNAIVAARLRGDAATTLKV